MNRLTDLQIDDLVIVSADKGMSNIVRVSGFADGGFTYLLGGELVISDIADIEENLNGEHREAKMEVHVIKLTCI